MANPRQAPKVSPAEIAQLEATIARTPPAERYTIALPPGYKLQPNGKLKYTAMNPDGNWLTRNVISKPQIMLPAVLGGAAALGSFIGGGASAATNAASGIGAMGSGAGAMEAGAGAAAAGTAGAAAGTAASQAAKGWTGNKYVNDAIDAATSAIPAVAGLAGAGSQPGTSPEASALLDQQRARMEQANPLYASLLQTVFNRLPTASRQGLNLPTWDQANASVPQVSGGDYAQDPATRNLLRTQLVRAKMSDPVQQAVLRLSQARMPRG